MSTIRDRERERRGMYRTTVSTAPRRFTRRVKTPPPSAIPCRVKNALGQYYDLDPLTNWLEINLSNPDGHLFQSRHKASRRVWHTIEKLRSELIEWDGKDFFLENVG